MNLNVKYGLWMTMTCQCRLINCNKCIMLVPDGDGGEAVHAWGWWCMATLYFLLSFTVDLKLL